MASSLVSSDANGRVVDAFDVRATSAWKPSCRYRVYVDSERIYFVITGVGQSLGELLWPHFGLFGVLILRLLKKGIDRKRSAMAEALDRTPPSALVAERKGSFAARWGELSEVTIESAGSRLFQGPCAARLRLTIASRGPMTLQLASNEDVESAIRLLSSRLGAGLSVEIQWNDATRRYIAARQARCSDRGRSPTMPASPSDYRVFVRLFAELAVPESPPSRERFERYVAPDAVVVRDGQNVVGYAWARARGDRLHVVHVVTDLQHRRRGVGRALMNAVAERGRAAGFQKWMLNVKPDNLAACALYERCGMRVALASVSMRLRWADVERLEATPGVTTLPLGAGDDRPFEAALGMPPGEISAFRALGRIVIGSQGTDGAAGFAAFDPSGPSASPFRVSAPGYARALLDALRPHRVAGRDHVDVFVEGNPSLERELGAAGAAAVMRVVRMEGEIPS